MRRNNTLHNLTIFAAMLVVALFMAGCNTQGDEALPEIPVANILIQFKLDKLLVSSNYGGDIWVSPPAYGPILHPGDQYVLEARAEALDRDGQRLQADFEWIPENPEMVVVSPAQGSQVTITVLSEGRSILKVTSQGFTKTLVIEAVYQNAAIRVTVSQ